MALWLAAMLEIGRHTRGSDFPRTGLFAMATLVSVVAAVALAASSALFAEGWFEAAARSDLHKASTGELAGGGTMRTYSFSFGMENAPYAPEDPNGPGNNE